MLVVLFQRGEPMRRILSLAIVAIMSMSFISASFGCSKPHDQVQVEPDTAAKKTVITFAHWSTSSSDVIARIVSQYNKTNKDGITVNIIKIPDDDVDETLNLMFTSGQAPDIYGIDPGKVSLFASNGWIADLSAFIDEAFLSRFPDYAVQYSKSYNQENKFFTIPSIADTYRLIYNRDLFIKSGLDPDKPPTTLSELRDDAKKIRNACANDNVYGFALPAADDWAAYCLAMEYPATASGLTYFDFSQGKYNLSAYKPWLQFFIDMRSDGSIFPSELYLTNNIARMKFAEGDIGMMFAGSWDPSVFDTQFPAKCDWDVAEPPVLDEAHKGSGALTMQMGYDWGIYAKTKHMSQAVAFWKFLYSDEFLGTLFKNGCVLPILKGITSNPDYKPALKNFDKFFPTDRESAYPPTPFTIDENSRWVYYKDALSGKSPVDKCLEDGGDYLNALLRQEEQTRGLDIGAYVRCDFDAVHPMNR